MLTENIVAWRNDQPISYQEFQARIFDWRALLEHTPGNKFALYVRDSLEFACALWGAWLAGKIVYLPHNVLPDTCSMLNNIVNGFLGEFPPEFSPLHPKSNFSLSAQKWEFSIFKSLMDSRFRENDGKDIAVVIYTSGSTGEPKAVQKKFSQLFTEISTLENLFGNIIGSQKTEILSTVSHEHLYGLLFKILWPLFTGRVFHIQTAMFLEEIAPLINSRECILISSPAHLKRFYQNSVLELTQSSEYLRVIFSSASALSFDTLQNIKKTFGKSPIEIYGSTETGGIAWRQRDSQSDESWRPLPDVNWRISAENHLLEISSPHLDDNNWLCTSDRVSISSADKHYFILQGRADRIIKIEGKRISLDAVERQLLKSPLISEVRVLMLESNNRQSIAAFVVLSENGQNIYTQSGKIALNKQLRDFLGNLVERIALPRLWRYLPALPINKQGKTTHTELMALLDKPIMPNCNIVEKNINKATLELTIPPNLIYFDGHFPETPILPGVVQIHWAIAYGRQYFNLPLSFRAIHKLKFQRVIQANMKIILELNYDENKTILMFRLYSQSGQHASGSILFNETV